MVTGYADLVTSELSSFLPYSPPLLWLPLPRSTCCVPSPRQGHIGEVCPVPQPDLTHQQEIVFADCTPGAGEREDRLQSMFKFPLRKALWDATENIEFMGIYTQKADYLHASLI